MYELVILTIFRGLGIFTIYAGEITLTVRSRLVISAIFRAVKYGTRFLTTFFHNRLPARERVRYASVWVSSEFAQSVLQHIVLHLKAPERNAHNTNRELASFAKLFNISFTTYPLETAVPLIGVAVYTAPRVRPSAIFALLGGSRRADGVPYVLCKTETCPRAGFTAKPAK